MLIDVSFSPSSDLNEVYHATMYEEHQHAPHVVIRWAYPGNVKPIVTRAVDPSFWCDRLVYVFACRMARLDPWADDAWRCARMDAVAA